MVKKAESTTKTTVKKSSSTSTKTDTKVSTKSSSSKTSAMLNPNSDRNLVIVESPAKAKTLKKFLGNNYDIKASMGHVTDLSKKKLGIDIENGFKPTYEISPDKKKIITEFKSILSNYGKVFLASDDDLEGEAIAWHIATVLGLDIKTNPRITFREITKTALENSIKNPRTINMNRVNAQQSRRLLDRLVGFKISPILWQKIKRGLSAGRVQSVTVKLVIEKENEIKKFIPVESWKIKAEVSYKNKKFVLSLEKLKGKNIELKNIDDVKKYLSAIGLNIESFKLFKDKKNGYLTYTIEKSIEFNLDKIEKKESKRYPSPPFVTSTLLQESSRRFGWGAKQVMSIAQKLYENGHITYMRTDSVNLSTLAIGASKDYIEKTFGEKYSSPKNYATKSANAQEAHEAIRPSYIDKTPEKTGLSGQELKLYGVIWARTVASQMSPAIVDTTTYTFNPIEDTTQGWLAKGEVIKFDGFLKLFENTKEDDEEVPENEDSSVLPTMEEGETLKSSTITASQTFSKPPARYTEASLIKKLESLGIGRPSTYAPTISTVQDRGYVAKDGKFLIPTDIAFVVNDYLEKFFNNIMDYKFTAGMEQSMDDVAEGKLDWQKMLGDFYSNFEKHLDKAGEGETAKVYTGEKCPECGGGLIYKFSQTGKFIGCENYPDCKYTKATQEQSDQLKKLKDKYEGQPCPEGGTIVVKIGRFGPFLTSSEYPRVKRISSIPDENLIELEAKLGGKKCAKCGEGIMHVKKNNKPGRSKNKYFLACDRYPDCKTIENIVISEEKKEEEE